MGEWYCKTYNPLLCGSIDGTDTIPHDNAIKTALQSHYDPFKDSNHKGDQDKTLFVTRLHPRTTEKDLTNVFEKYGQLQSVFLVRNIVTGESMKYAFIEFVREKDCQYAYKKSDHSMIDGQKILVDFERGRVMEGWIPRRFGGGFGGKKESGQLRFGGKDRPFKQPFGSKIRIEKNVIPKELQYEDCWRRTKETNEKKEFSLEDEMDQKDKKKEKKKDKHEDRDKKRDRDRDRDEERERDRERKRKRDRSRDRENHRERDRSRDKDKNRRR